MSKSLLQVGDIIRLEKGMFVYGSIPEKFSRCSYAPFSSKLVTIPFEIGEILSKHLLINKDGLTERICEQVLCMTGDVKTEEISNFIESLNLDFSHEEFDTSMFVGEYRVFNVVFGHNGPEKSDFRDDHENVGWKIFCEKVDNPEIRVYFFITGKLATTANRNIKPIRH